MFDFFKKLLPNFDKRRLVMQCDNVDQNASSVVSVILEQLVEARKETLTDLFTKSEYANRFIKSSQRRFGRDIQPNALNNVETILLSVTAGLRNKLEIIRNYIDVLFSDKVATTGLSFKQVEVLRLLDLFSFYTTYSMKFIHMATYEHFIKSGLKCDNVLTPAEVKWLNANYDSFINICAILVSKDNDFKAIIDKTSDLEIAESEDNVHVLGTNADPMRLGFVPVLGTVILMVREHFLENEVKRYEANKLRLQSIQLQLQMLRELQQQNPEDKTLARQIDYYTNRIKKLEVEVRKFEDSVGA